LPFVASAQSYFNERYPLASGYSAALTILPVANGYWFAGAAQLTPASSLSLILQKLDPVGGMSGPLKTFTQSGVDFYAGTGPVFLPMTDGGMALMGSSIRNGGLTGHGQLWRFNAQGDTLWSRIYSDPVVALIFRGGCHLPDGGYALVGETAVVNSSSRDYVDVLLLRTDSLGHELWRRSYHQGYFDTGKFLLPTSDGGLLISGTTYAFSPGTTRQADGMLIKVDSLGREQWRTLFGGSWVDIGGPILPTPGGGCVMGGTSSDTIGLFGQWATKPTVFWFDSAGTLVRERAYGPGRPSTGTLCFLPLADGGYLLGGQVTDTARAPIDGGGNAEGFLVRVCADGDSVWYRTYKKVTGSFSDNYLRDIGLAPDGGFVGAGFVAPRFPDTGTQDAWVFKTDANGYLQAGGAPPGGVCRPLGLPPELELGTVSLWPNPSPDGRYQLTVELPDAQGLVTDALGQVVWQGAITGAATVIDLSRQAAGLYVLRLTWPTGQSVTKKLVR
jgi:hypothetical protein